MFRHANVVSTQAPKPSKAGNGALQLHPAMPPAPKLQSEDGHTHLAVTSWSGTLQQHQHPGPKTRTRMSSCTWSKNTKSSRYLRNLRANNTIWCCASKSCVQWHAQVAQLLGFTSITRKRSNIARSTQSQMTQNTTRHYSGGSQVLKQPFDHTCASTGTAIISI